jgi:hypothetical protein
MFKIKSSSELGSQNDALETVASTNWAFKNPTCIRSVFLKPYLKHVTCVRYDEPLKENI